MSDKKSDNIYQVSYMINNFPINYTNLPLNSEKRLRFHIHRLNIINTLVYMNSDDKEAVNIRLTNYGKLVYRKFFKLIVPIEPDDLPF